MQIVTFGIYEGRPIEEMLQSYDYCNFLLNSGTFRTNYPDMYKTVKERVELVETAMMLEDALQALEHIRKVDGVTWVHIEGEYEDLDKHIIDIKNQLEDIGYNRNLHTIVRGKTHEEIDEKSSKIDTK